MLPFRSPGRALGRGATGLFLVLAAFSYGFVSHRHQLFPYGIIAALAGPRSQVGKAPPAATTLNAPPTGRWRLMAETPQGAVLEEEDLVNLEALQGLGYLSGHDPAPSRSGVTKYDPAAAQAGVNLYNSGHAAEAVLMGMRGEVLHRWSLSFEEAFPGRKEVVIAEGWRRVHLLEGGELLAIFDNGGLVKLDRDSRLMWSDERYAHHDIFVDDDGAIYTLSWEATLVPDLLPDDPVMVDFIDIRDPDGVLKDKISILEAFRNSPFAPLLNRLPRKTDIFHTNTLEVLDGRFVERSPFFRKGNLLISVRYLDTIAIIDPDARAVVWALSGMWRWQHQPTFLDNGNLLVFDNLGGDGWSQVIEIDPLTQKIQWAYRGGPRNRFFTKSCGSNQRLPNGNTLITESDRGRAFELTPDGRTVWEFWNPHRAGPDNELIATLYEVVRLPVEQAGDWARPGDAE